MSSPKDKDIEVFNPLSGKFDTVRKFNPDRLISHQLNPAGNPLMEYDIISGTYYEAGPQLVFDEEGNVVYA